jgi:GxxExxY protein
MKTREELEELIPRVIGALIEVHRELGPGFLEGIYRRAIEIEFARREIPFESEKPITLHYCGKKIGRHRLDLLVDGSLVIELKTVDVLHKKHYAQVRSYLKATHSPIGLLVNFADYQVDPRRVELNS